MAPNQHPAGTGLQRLTGVRVAAESNLREGAGLVDHEENERAAVVEVPDLVGADAVQGRELLPRQKEVDRRREGASSLTTAGKAARAEAAPGSIGLAEVAPLGMSLEAEFLDPVV